MHDPYFTRLNDSDLNLALPDKFTFPFYYEPHPISIYAAELLMNFLDREAASFGWDFGLDGQLSEHSRGRMFGVLIVKNKNDELGFLAAYSGNTSIENKGYNFVPTVNDFWDENGFYVKGINEFDKLSYRIIQLENDSTYQNLLLELETEKSTFDFELNKMEFSIRQSKILRDEIRNNQFILNPELLKKLSEDSKNEHIALKKFKKQHKEKIKILESEIDNYTKSIEVLKSNRKSLSKTIQEKIYDGFQFLNKFGEKKNLKDIFLNTVLKQPPSGAGECAAPRLLQYAFLQNYLPIAMAEFWWGTSSKSELRRHKHYYPACKGKCEPILEHMLKGIDLDIPFLENNSSTNIELDIVFEDDYLMVVNKPAGLLSVPGKITTDSVLKRLVTQFSKADFRPMIVHRLDMDTSGLLVVAKHTETYKQLQALFAKRKVKKTYVAILDGYVPIQSGTIELKLSSDFLNRPRQIVDDENGKTSITEWTLIKKINNKSLIYFYPLTGRTHQLRIHAAHEDGLNCPILGDDLYGKKADRLYLHAESLEFEHPVSKKLINIIQKCDFDTRM
jgi:tRNA pseudouridine32 synthase/23S rRNA pseudouridine746 synthase